MELFLSGVVGLGSHWEWFFRFSIGSYFSSLFASSVGQTMSQIFDMFGFNVSCIILIHIIIEGDLESDQRIEHLHFIFFSKYYQYTLFPCHKFMTTPRELFEQPIQHLIENEIFANPYQGDAIVSFP